MGLMAFLATKYGKVTRGEYAGCGMGLGNDHGKKIEINAEANQLLFIKGFKEVARINVKEIDSFNIASDNNRETTVDINWKNGKKSTVVLSKLDPQEKPWPQDRVSLVLRALDLSKN